MATLPRKQGCLGEGKDSRADSIDGIGITVSHGIKKWGECID